MFCHLPDQHAVLISLMWFLGSEPSRVIGAKPVLNKVLLFALQPCSKEPWLNPGCHKANPAPCKKKKKDRKVGWAVDGKRRGEGGWEEGKAWAMLLERMALFPNGTFFWKGFVIHGAKWIFLPNTLFPSSSQVHGNHCPNDTRVCIKSFLLSPGGRARC